MRLDIYAARTETARNRANAAIKRIAVSNAQFTELGNALDKARHKDKEIEVLNEREAIAVTLEAIAAYVEAQSQPQPEPDPQPVETDPPPKE